MDKHCTGLQRFDRSPWACAVGYVPAPGFFWRPHSGQFSISCFVVAQQAFGGPFSFASHVLVQPCRCHHLGHKARQAPELQPWELLNLLAVTRELTGTVQVAGLFVLSAAVACIRFEHFQRSHACVQGKRRIQPRLWP